MTAKLAYIQDLEFHLDEDPISVGNGKFLLAAPYEGRILGSRNGPRISGCIQNAGSGAGTSTHLQVRNVTTGRTYFDTQPEFRVDDADGNGRASLYPGTLKLEPVFSQGDVIALDVDGLPTGADSALGAVFLSCEFLRSVDN